MIPFRMAMWALPSYLIVHQRTRLFLGSHDSQTQIEIRWMLCRLTDLSRLSLVAHLLIWRRQLPLIAQAISCDLPVVTDDWTNPPDLTDYLDCPALGETYHQNRRALSRLKGCCHKAEDVPVCCAISTEGRGPQRCA